MGKIALARVDERLIHGQVMTNLSKKSGANSIFIIDDLVAKDPFMTSIFNSAGGRTGLKVRILTVDDAIKEWNENQFGNFSCILLTKTISIMHQLVKGGCIIEELNLGGIAKKPGTTAIVSAVAITADDCKKLVEMRDGYGVKKIYFQSIPSSKSVDLKDAEKKF
ncbi:PTS sugar transporter subunit IIB [Clostridium sp. AL.422]|uniref:PTS system mannose/fructose/N-acetylgalactosamine-transporter subunit IIB n=1 Tax=Clostridium TaxID=1485 RepID=UPI00293DC631|nr:MULTISPECIES: PTS sugar transporter subunit IIB [unclassified Clostridium]MDV4149895.1 PTS sugar transporter subunit IIB [Clostridium sp. AL.422]